ncbi:hypothetical protein D3C75_1159590 [compost metagenome]
MSPTFFSTGKLSPVNMDSSTEVRPSITSPSTAILSPGFTITISPTTTSSIGTFSSTPSRTIRAVLAPSPINVLIASEVRPFANTSNNLPNSTNVINTALVS